MANPYFKDGALDRGPKKRSPVKEFKRGKQETIAREPLPKRPVSQRMMDRRTSNVTHVYHHKGI